MNGRVDEALRALIDIDVASVPAGDTNPITVWVDTAFNGQFVFPRPLIGQMRLDQHAATEAILADGRTVTLESYVAHLDWFGAPIAAQVIANDGQFPLLGTELLADRVLLIDYATRRLSLE